mmetsp:Transcript_30046/g.36660  ORF Transcript_30046/g.36660 Transcript_30046/m.36660 type:complete len:251 (+) Transcript_30046:95-847(+)
MTMPVEKTRNSDCSKCIQFLTSVLNAPRPRQLLAAMGANAYTNIDHSEINIEMNKNSLRTSTNESSAQLRDGDVTPLVQRTLATSFHGVSINTNKTSNSPNKSSHAVNNIKIQCKQCSSEGVEGGARAFVRGPDPVSIVLCANRLGSKDEVEEVLVHELVHVYDVRVRNMDLRDCKQLAYSEVRAAREAECHSSSRFTKSICTKQRATVATRNMFPDEGKDCVCDVFQSAMKDVSPFRLPGQKRPINSER